MFITILVYYRSSDSYYSMRTVQRTSNTDISSVILWMSLSQPHFIGLHIFHGLYGVFNSCVCDCACVRADHRQLCWLWKPVIISTFRNATRWFICTLIPFASLGLIAACRRYVFFRLSCPVENCPCSSSFLHIPASPDSSRLCASCSVIPCMNPGIYTVCM